MRSAIKALGRVVATISIVPFWISFLLRSAFFGPDRALEGSSQSLALVPGTLGNYIRRAFLRQVLAHCDETAVVEFGTIFSQAGARLDANVYVGPRCHLGLVHLERDVMLAAGVHVPSGPNTHGTRDTHRAMRDQPGTRSLVTIGEGAWIGSAAVVLAHVGRHAIVGAGAVVTHPIPDYMIAAGVPARVIRQRGADEAEPDLVAQNSP